MSMVARKTGITPDELLGMPNQKKFELVDGELLERNVSVRSSWVGSNLARLIGNHVDESQLGWVFGADIGYQCFSDRPRVVRRPDVSFVKAGRMTWGEITDGWLKVVPDLVVEVISPTDKSYLVEKKVEMFLKAGVPLMWIVHPNVRTIRIVRGDGSTAILRDADELTGEDILPGFTNRVESLFPPARQAGGDESEPER